MSTKPFDVVLAELAKPFDPEAVEFKAGAITQDKARALALAYVDARVYQARLDEVVPDWSNTYQREYADGRIIVTCTLTIAGVTRQAIGEALQTVLRPDGSTVVEENAATAAEAQAFKRTCAAFGLGRYLYSVPQVWADYDAAKRAFTSAALNALREMLRTGKLPPSGGAPADAPGHTGNGGNGNGHSGSGDASPVPVATAPTTQSPTPAPTPTAAPNGAKIVGPACPKCGGPMWDNRNSKKNPKAPDFRCKNAFCDGVIWPS